MNTLKKLTGLLLVSVFILSAATSTAGEVERTLAQKKFDVADNALLEIKHKFGNVKCTNWNENSISVKVTATVKASSTEKANKLFDRIKIKLEGNQNGVLVESDFSEKTFNTKNYEVSIDIEVMMPENIRLELDHKFGNAYIEVVSSQTSIDCEYGSIEIKALKGEVNDIEIDFGEARINYLNQGDVEISYSSLTIDEADDLSIETSYGNVSIDKIQKLDIENEGGNVELGEVGIIELSSKFSDFKIGLLHEFMSAETEYGSLRVKNISANFSEITIDNSFGSVEMNFDSQASFAIEATMELCNLNYPKEKSQFSMQIVDSTDKYYKGTIGSGSGKSHVSIESSYGNVDIDM